MPGTFRPRPGQRVVYLTGAGLSARAGLPTFRGEDGLWAIHPELEAAMHAEALPGSLPELWRIWPELFAQARRNGPTPGHRAIARMGAPVITQNIDGLHQAAGSEDVIELHGCAGRACCMDADCTWTMPIDGDIDSDTVSEPDTGTDSDTSGGSAGDHGVPERCPACGSATRPDVVLFDEMLPAAAIEGAQRLAEEADVFVAVGTSGVVFPAAALAPIARRAGATTVLIDIDPADPVTARTVFDHVITADAHEILPEWEKGRDAGTNPFLQPF